MRRPAAVVLAVLVLVAAAVACDPPSRLTVSTVWSGLDRPWDLAFTPGGGMLITEKSGAVKLGSFDGTLRTLVKPADARVSGEGGMMGLAVDPQFASNRHVYTCFLSDRSGSLDVRVVRWTMDRAGTSLGSRADIVTGIPVNTEGQAGRHSGCRPRFGPDGYLWVTTGDAAMGFVPQSPTSLGGKVLRVDRNGAGAPGNPGGALDARIYSYGHRNPQGISWRPGDGRPFSVEHGTGCDDEVNLLVPGANYGWDPSPLGAPSDHRGYDESRPMTDTARHPGARVAVWSSGCPTIAPSGATFLADAGHWGAFANGLALAVLKGQQLRVMKLDGPDSVVSDEWVRVADQGRLRSAVVGPDNNLYLATDASPGRILRVVPTL